MPRSRRRDRRVILKVVRYEGEEWRSGEILAAFDGNGLVRALEFRDGAVLLERLDPGNDLSILSMAGRDEEATEIIADVIARMSRVRPAVQGIRSVREMMPEFKKYRHTCDHLMPIGGDPNGPAYEGWTLLSALAAQTQRLRIGVLVTSNRFRPPAMLAKIATTVDIVSGGRLEFGIGAGSRPIQFPLPREFLQSRSEWSTLPP